MTRAFSGRDAADLTFERLLDEDIGADDVRIHPETLLHQADQAAAYGNPQLAENFRRASELSMLPEAEVMALYEALRPHRSSATELAALAERLEALPAPRCAALVREAAKVYERRSLLRPQA